jgi:hypothetical protein
MLSVRGTHRPSGDPGEFLAVILWQAGDWGKGRREGVCTDLGLKLHNSVE